MKQRFSYLDLRLISNEMAMELTNCRLQNVYSLESSNRHFMFKFDAEGNQSGKQFMLVDPGLRCHLTKYQHESTPQPSHFVQKLRKYLKTRRASSFWVAPSSRLMVITFSEGQYYLVFEFFSGGNIILLNNEYKILTLFRVVRDLGPSHQTMQIGETYPLQITETTPLQGMPSDEDLQAWITKDKLGKTLYSKVSDPSSSLLEYFLRTEGLDPKIKLSPEEAIEKLDNVKVAVRKSLERAHALMNHNGKTPGYILRDGDKNSLEFEPFREYFDLTSPNNPIEEHPSYNEAVDVYFGAILLDKQVNKHDQLLAVAESRLEAARNERKKRVEALESQASQHAEYGTALQEHADLVEAAINAVRALVDQGVDWGDAEQLIKLEKEKGNNVAQIIHSLQLQKSQVTLLLNDLKISVSIDRSAFANARDYFEVKRSADAKVEKTEQHASKALKSAEIKIKRDLEVNLAKQKKQGAASQLHAIRTPHWFEKFYWFITTSQLLVIGGRDEAQNDILLRRYFEEGDVIVCSEAPEAALLIVKNPSKNEIAPQSLLQVAAFCVATSTKAWEAKMKSPCWMFTRKQVPKINNAGDPISLRDVRLLNHRAWIPPTPIDMGMTYLWQCETNIDSDDEESKKKDAANSAESEEEFPDTQFDSDDFPDTRVSSDDDADSDSGDEGEEDPTSSDVSARASPPPPPKPELDLKSDEARADASEDKALANQLAESAHKELTERQKEQPADSEPENSEPAKSTSTSNNYQDGAPELDTGSDSDLDTTEENTNDSNNKLEPPELSSGRTSASPQPDGSTTAAPKKVRGRKKKLLKYQAQDEEDRLQAMERLGTLKGLQRKAEEKEKKESSRKAQQDVQKYRKDKRRAAELARITAADGPAEPTPFPSDLLITYKEDEPIIGAVPMFAPWASLQKMQYKLKIVPGTLKKGKAANEIAKHILNTGPVPASQHEQQLAEALKSTEIQQAIAVSRIQISTSAATSKQKPTKNTKGNAARGKKKK